MKPDFQNSANSRKIEEFKQRKIELSKELSDILGFDISLLKNVQPAQKNFSFEYQEQNFNGYMQGEPLYFGFEMQTKGLMSWLTLSWIDNPCLRAFKMDDEWHISTVAFDKKCASTDHDKIREGFFSRLDALGINMEELQETKTIDIQQGKQTPKAP